VLIEQAQANVRIQEEGLRIAEARFQGGATSELDVSQSRTLLESTRATIPQLQASRQQAENALATLLGETSGSVGAVLKESKDIPSPPDQVAISIPADMLRRRADIRAAELLAMAQSDRIGIAKADFYPRLFLFGSIGARGGDADSDVASFLSTDTGFFSLGPRLLWPVLNYGRIKNNVRIEDARFQQSLVNYKDSVLRAGQEVEDALAGFRRNQEAAIYARNAAEAARQSVNLAFVQYREGAVDFQRVLDAQRSQLREENTLTQIRSSVATSLIALYKALGGGWEVQEGQPFVSENNQREMQGRTNWSDFFDTSPTPPASDAPQTNPRR
jgi:NodT family efflux transporter outer membrane factor (OMF) lipoprotein